MQTGGESGEHPAPQNNGEQYAQHIRTVIAANDAWTTTMLMHNLSRVTDYDVPQAWLKSATKYAITELAATCDEAILQAKESDIVHKVTIRATRIATEMISSKHGRAQF